MIVVDTSALVAYVNAADSHHADVSRVFEHAPESVTSLAVLAEFDYLVRTRVGRDAARKSLRALLREGLQLAELRGKDVERALTVDEAIADLNIGLTDASLVVLAERFDTRTIATLDLRHFRAVTPLQGGSFTLLPADL
jgi:predicted nucleic acid-binding protein